MSITLENLLVKRRLFDRILTYIIVAVNVLAVVKAVVLANFWIYYIA